MSKLSENIKKFLRELDQFGVVFKPSITSDSEYKTVLGGILSILLYGVSLGYFIYQFVIWKEGGMLPKITVSSEVIETQQIYFDEPLFSIRMRKMNDTNIDPFNPQNIIMLPLIFQYINGQLSTTPSIPIINKTNNDNEFVTIYFNNITLAISKDKTIELPELEYMILLIDCVPQLLANNTEMKCANSTTRKSFFNQSVNTLYFTTFVKQFNAQQEKINTFGNEVIVALDPSSVYFSTSTLQLQETTIDNGLLFENTYQRNFILDISTAGQQVNSKFFSSVINSTTYFINNYQLNGIKSIQYIQYPKINEVLADTGSIVSILLLTSAFVIMTNQYFLESEAISQVINMFYPNLKYLKYKKNWYGKIIRIELLGRNLNINKFNVQYGKLKEVAQTKLTITNQIYEISRIQFILQSMIDRSNLNYSHMIGIKENNFIENTKEENEFDNQEGEIFKDSKVIPSNDSKLEIQQNQQIQQTMFPDQSSNTILPNETQKLEIFQQLKSENQTSNNDKQFNSKELIDQDFELLICKKDRTEAQILPQFFDINKVT
ncbi:unnamed protein product [Paramecium pentaurelia]|uniref:Transmembrane protein n=1 Tax=Paramecium pentaurelia TaxID=43138 RepID=A0A8S1WR69_9CILI|nr:unnamed protein product [Paramecium pentaurelia]